jgi:hypothetical protein
MSDLSTCLEIVRDSILSNDFKELPVSKSNELKNNKNSNKRQQLPFRWG